MSIAPIVQTVHVKPAPARAFEVFTADISHWWPKGRTLAKTPHSAIVIEPHAGGRWFERDADGNETNWGQVLAWEPPRRLLLGWQINCDWGFQPDLLTEVELTFVPAENGSTRVTLEHRNLERFGTDAARHAEKLRGGWPTQLSEFMRYADADQKGEAVSNFIVHSIPGSPYGRAVLAALHEKGAPHKLAAVAPGTFGAEPHISRHPFARVPVLEHAGFVLYETQAILRYLDRVLPSPPLTPAGARAAARMNQVMNVNDWYLFNGVGNVIVFHRVVGPRVMGRAPDEAAIEAAMPKAHRVFDELGRLLGDKGYFAGDEVSLADLMVAPQLDMFTEAPEWAPLTTKNANLVGWLARMNARPSMQATTWPRVREMAQAA